MAGGILSYFRRPPFDPDKDISDLSGKVALVTGGTTGIGKEALLLLAEHNPAALYFTGRNVKSASKVIADIKAFAPSIPVTFLECDFTDLETVRIAAERFLSSSLRLDILNCNAGIMNVSPALTTQGYEIEFGTNHLAHALLIKLLLPTLEHTAAIYGDARVVSNTSLGFKMAPAEGIRFSGLRSDGSATGAGGSGIASWDRYAQSKLANVAYTGELARRYPAITAVSVHPGVVRTELIGKLSFWKKLLVTVTNPLSMLTPREGAFSQTWCATVDKAEIQNGGYYEPVGKKGVHTRQSGDEELARRLWEWTQEELQAY